MSGTVNKKIHTWEYEDRTRGIAFSVPVHMVGGKGATRFRVDLTDPVEISLCHESIDELKKLVWAEIPKKFNVKWEPFLYVTIRGSVERFADLNAVEESRPYRKRDRATSITLEVNRVELRTDNDGKQFYRFVGSNRTSGPQEGRPDAGQAKRDDDNYYDRRGVSHPEMQAYIPDTAENRAALDSIASGFGLLVDRLQNLLHPKSIEASLHAALHTRLLPAPEATTKKNRAAGGAS